MLPVPLYPELIVTTPSVFRTDNACNVLHINIVFRLSITWSHLAVGSVGLTAMPGLINQCDWRRGWLVVCWLAGEWSENHSDLHCSVLRFGCSRFRVRALNQFCLGQRSLSEHHNPKHFPSPQSIHWCNLSLWNLHIRAWVGLSPNFHSVLYFLINGPN